MTLDRLTFAQLVALHDHAIQARRRAKRRYGLLSPPHRRAKRVQQRILAIAMAQ